MTTDIETQTIICETCDAPTFVYTWDNDGDPFDEVICPNMECDRF